MCAHAAWHAPTCTCVMHLCAHCRRVSVVKPQIHNVRLWSATLQKFVNIKTTPQMLRYGMLAWTAERDIDLVSLHAWACLSVCKALQLIDSSGLGTDTQCNVRHRYIEACGGLDDYLRKTPDKELKSDVASSLKWRISQAQAAAKLKDTSSGNSQSSTSQVSGKGKSRKAADAPTTSDSHANAASSGSSAEGAALPGARPLSPGAAAVLHAKQELDHARTASAVRSLAAAAGRPSMFQSTMSASTSCGVW